MSKSIRMSELYSRKSSLQKEDKDESRTYSYVNLCRDHFLSPNTSAQFSLKDLKHPLLKHTPDKDTDVVIKIWRTVIRFITNDVARTDEAVFDQSQNRTRTRRASYSSSSSISTVSASVTLRLSQETAGNEFDLTTAEENQRDTGSRLSGTLNTILLRQLTSKLMQSLRISTKDQGDRISRLEDSLTSGFEQMQYIVGWGLMSSTVRDEIYSIILRQLTNNPQKAWRFRAWVLLSLTVGIFLPSDKIMLYVTKFIDDGPATFSGSLKKLFVRVITNGPRHQPPSYQEYQAVMGRKCLTLNVTLMDGSRHSVEADSSTTSLEIISSISRTIDLKEKFGFSLFIAMTNKVSSLGSEGDKVMDTVSQCEQLFRNQHSLPEADAPWRLFMRKELFSPWDDVSMDTVANSLIFAQICRGVVLGEYVPDTDAELEILAAKQYYCEFENEVSEEGLTGIIPGYIPSKKLGDQKKLRVWCRRVAQCYRKLFNLTGGKLNALPTVDEVKGQVINWAKAKWATSFSRYFDVIRVNSPEGVTDSLTLALNSNGMSLLTVKGKQVLDAPYSLFLSINGEGQDADLRSISGSVIIITLVGGTILKFETIDCNEIYQVMTHCIRGLKERSTWAIAKSKYEGLSVGQLTVSEGDLLRLERTAKGEALTASTACCTNMADPQRTGNLPTELLLIISTLNKPTEEILRSFRSSFYHSAKSDDGLRENHGSDYLADEGNPNPTPLCQNHEDDFTNSKTKQFQDEETGSCPASPVVVIEQQKQGNGSFSSGTQGSN